MLEYHAWVLGPHGNVVSAYFLLKQSVCLSPSLHICPVGRMRGKYLFPLASLLRKLDLEPASSCQLPALSPNP